MAHTNISIVGSGRRIDSVADHLRARGHRLAVHDPTRREALLAAGNLLPADVAEGADLLVVDVSEGRLYDDSVYQIGGICDALPTGASVLDLSPQGPAAARKASDTFGRYGINYTDGLLLNMLGRRRGCEPTLLTGTAAADDSAYDPLTAALGARRVHVGRVGLVSLARLVLQDAYEMAIRFLGETVDSDRYDGLDEVGVDPRTLAAVMAIVGDRRGARSSGPNRLRAVAA